MTDLSGKIVVITGAGGNLGQCMAKTMAARGARLVLSDFNESSLNECREAIVTQGGTASSIRCDVTEEDELHQLMDFAVSEFGGIDVLVNNAGIIGQEHRIEILDLDLALWDRTMAINLRSVFMATKAGLPHLIARGGGSIINISSDSSIRGHVMTTAYAASKGAINTLTKYTAAQYGKQNIRCNAILPGIHLSEEALARTPADAVKRIADQCMLPRIGVPEDIARMAAFLASEDSYYVTAQLLQVDGGLCDHVPIMADARNDPEGLYRSALKQP